MFRVSSEELWIFRNRHSLCIKVLQKSSVACFIHIYIYMVKVKFNLEQATKAQRGSRGIALLIL